MAPPQLAQPSPSAYPRPPTQDESPGKRGREESPSNGDPKGKPNALTVTSRHMFWAWRGPEYLTAVFFGLIIGLASISTSPLA